MEHRLKGVLPIMETYSRGITPSLIQKFEIRNLHGYKTIALDSPYAATILIAQNGAGKTTLLNALDAFLRGQFLRLNDLNFTEIVCQLAGSEELVISHDDVKSLTETALDSEIAVYAKSIQVEPASLVNFLSKSFSVLRSDVNLIRDDKVYEATYRAFDYNSRRAFDHLEKLQTQLFDHNPSIASAIATIRSALKDYEVLYLPTFRRIESPLATNQEDRYRRRRSSFKIPFSTFTGDVQFGLSDISDHLSDLHQQIVFQSNRGYQKLSADIIRELLDGSFERSEISEFFLPSSDDLKLFFNRLQEGRRVGPFYEVVTPDIDDLLETRKGATETNRFLLYFISKLNSVMQATKDIESKVEEFVRRCNTYLQTEDELSLKAMGSQLPDTKELRLDRANMSVHAVSLPSGRKIALDALSSGEKQMISLLAKLYLYDKQKVVLIDEPELSLSIEWQRKILEDVVNAPTCTQLVAITHSPFVFDNPLEPFARSLRVSVDSSRIPEVDILDDHDGELNL
jgi:predicted ATPase